jgi:cell division protease FtsH
MAAQAPPTSRDASGAQLPPGTDRPPERPWRAEGLPKDRSPSQRRRWTTAAFWVVGYLLLFGILTVQDRLSEPEPIPYTEFKTQVANKNVGELFARGDSVQGQLKKAAPVPGQQNRTYQQFTTERPTFASDDLLGELTAGR